MFGVLSTNTSLKMKQAPFLHPGVNKGKQSAKNYSQLSHEFSHMGKLDQYGAPGESY